MQRPKRRAFCRVFPRWSVGTIWISLLYKPDKFTFRYGCESISKPKLFWHPYFNGIILVPTVSMGIHTGHSGQDMQRQNAERFTGYSHAGAWEQYGYPGCTSLINPPLDVAESISKPKLFLHPYFNGILTISFITPSSPPYTFKVLIWEVIFSSTSSSFNRNKVGFPSMTLAVLCNERVA